MTATLEPLPYDIAIVGLGLKGVYQLTREVEEALRRCQEVFVIDAAVGALDYLNGLCPKVTDLYDEYRPGEHRIPIYRRMASAVIARALDHPPVAFATYGHPKVGCYPSTLIDLGARIFDLRVAVLPGVSAIDTLLVDLKLDPAMDGLQIYEATDMVIRARPIQTDVPCVIMQPAITTDPFNNPGKSNREGLERLQNYLLQFYPAEHQATIVVSSTHPLLDSIVQSFKLSNAAAAIASTPNIATILIPPAAIRPVADAALAAQMQIPGDDTARLSPVERRPGRPQIGPQDSKVGSEYGP
jgi:hypothetical protein